MKREKGADHLWVTDAPRPYFLRYPCQIPSEGLSVDKIDLMDRPPVRVPRPDDPIGVPDVFVFHTIIVRLQLRFDPEKILKVEVLHIHVDFLSYVLRAGTLSRCLPVRPLLHKSSHR